MRCSLTIVATCILSIIGLAQVRGDIIAASYFDTDAEGWTIFGDGTNLTWLATGGNPGGHIRGSDIVAGNTWYFNAPAKFLGDVSNAYGQQLTFDLRQSATDSQYDTADIILVGGGLTIVFDTSPNPDSVNFTPYAVPLLGSAGWKLDNLGGPVATEAQMQTVLGSLTGLRIRGEYRTGPDMGFLDNVVLNGGVSVPEPSNLSLLAAGTFGLIITARRRDSRLVRKT